MIAMGLLCVLLLHPFADASLTFLKASVLRDIQATRGGRDLTYLHERGHRGRHVFVLIGREY